MKEYALSVYLERLDNLIEEGTRAPLDQQLLDQLRIIVSEIWWDGFHASIDQSERRIENSRG
jgi:hypothetical protein